MTELTTDTSPDVNDDLAAVEAEMFGKTPDGGAKQEETDATKPEESVAAGVGEGDGDGAGDKGPSDAGDADEGDGEDDAERTERQKRSTADRIKRLNADKRYWEREAMALKARLAEKEAGGDQPKENAAAGLTPEKAGGNSEAVQAPDPTKYRFGELDPQYVSDLADYRAELKLQAFRKEQQEAQQAAAAAQEADKALAQVREKATKVIEAATAKFSDFDEVVVQAAMEGAFALTQEMFETAAETAVAGDILYHLAKNPDEAAQVAEMTPRQQALWFGRMEAKFSSPAPAPSEGRKVTQASPPVTSLPKGSGGSGGPKLDDLDDPRALEEIERQLFGRKK